MAVVCGTTRLERIECRSHRLEKQPDAVACIRFIREDETMSESPNRRARHSQLRWIIIASAMLLLPVLYVLSIGPAGWANQNGYLPDDIRGFYAPIVWLHDNTPLAKPLDWYGELWGFH